MFNRELHRYESEIDHLFKMAQNIKDEETKTHFAKYICVRIAGYIEKSVYQILYNYTKQRSSNDVLGYVDKKLSRFTNAKTKKILDLLSEFNPQLNIQFEDFIKEEYKDSIDSVVRLRHRIAHGEYEGLTLSRIYRYYIDIKKAVGELKNICC